MSSIREINVNDRENWNKLVRSFADYDVYYLNEYVTAFMNEDKSNGEPVLLYYENGLDRAINVVFKRDVAEGTALAGKVNAKTYYDLVSPYGYGGFSGNITDYDELNSTYNAHCSEQGYVCEFVRFSLFTDYYKFYDGKVETRTHNVIRSLDITLDEMWMDFKQKVRKNVKKANEKNLEIKIENTGENLEDFLSIYYSTMDRSNAKDEYYFSEGFYKAINEMKDNIMYFHVVYEGKIISTELVIYGSEHAYSYLGGTNREYFDLRPNDFLKYEIIKWAKEKGLKSFVLGGGYGSDDGIFQYKTCLAPHGVVDFYIGEKIFDKERYCELVELHKKDNPDCITSAFFPQYRA